MSNVVPLYQSDIMLSSRTKQGHYNVKCTSYVTAESLRHILYQTEYINTNPYSVSSMPCHVGAIILKFDTMPTLLVNSLGTSDAI